MYSTPDLVGQVLGFSVAIRLAGFTWSIVLLHRLRDWRLSLVSLTFALMALRQVLTLSRAIELSPPVAVASELPGLGVSGLAFAAVILLGRMLADRELVGTRRRSEEERYRSSSEKPSDDTVVHHRGERVREGHCQAAQALESSEAETCSVEDLRPPAIKAVADRQAIPFEAGFRRRGRGPSPAEVSANRFEGGGVPRVKGIVRPISERQRRQAAERKVRQQAAVLDKASDAISCQDLDGKVRYWNPSAENLFGWTAEEALGRDLRRLLDPVEGLPLEEAMQAVAEKGEWSGELRLRARGGGERIVYSRWTLVGGGGEPKSVLVLTTDLTEKKQLEARYLRAQRMESIGALAGGIAHDLSNVLAPLLLAVELLRPKLPDPDDREILDSLEAATGRGVGLVRQILWFCRGIGGERIGLDLRHLLKEVQGIANDTFPKGISVVTDYPPELPLVTGDPTQLYQVLMNLAVNARDAMPGGGRLTLSASGFEVDNSFAAMHPDAVARWYAVLSVADTGGGIPGDHLGRIFEPFFTTKQTGTGTGLSTAQSILRSHGGFIDVESTPGTGTTFRLYLPADAPGGAPAARPALASTLEGRGRTVLVVDDEEAVRRVIAEALRKLGFRVLTAADGTEAIALYAQRRNENVDAVVMDLAMPHLDGPATIRALRRLDPAVRVIVASGLPEAPADLLEQGSIAAFVAKPFTSTVMAEALRQVLGDGANPPGGDR